MIKNVIFDVGDVLLEYRWRDMLRDHGLSDEEAERVGTVMFEDSLWAELDLYIRSEEEIIEEYKKKYPEDGKIIEWFITHGEQMHVNRRDIWKQVHLIKEKGYKIYILSNYSKGLFEKHTAGADFLKDMDGMVVSYEIHKVKPDPAIYKYLLNKYALNPEECIFFDDRKANTQAAEKLGIKAVTVLSHDFLKDTLNKMFCLEEKL